MGSVAIGTSSYKTLNCMRKGVYRMTKHETAAMNRFVNVVNKTADMVEYGISRVESVDVVNGIMIVVFRGEMIAHQVLAEISAGADIDVKNITSDYIIGRVAGKDFEFGWLYPSVAEHIN
jgi:hypothetical protein